MVGVLDNDICITCDCIAHDALVQGVVPDGGRRDHNTVFTKRLCKFFKVFRLATHNFVTGFFERGRVKQAIAAQIFVVITNQQLKFGGGYGLVAQEFIEVMEDAGVAFFHGDGRTPRSGPIQVDFERLIQLDSLIENPPKTLDDLWDRLVEGDRILDLFKQAWQAFSPS